MTWLLAIGIVMFIVMLFVGSAVANEERKRVDAIYAYDPMFSGYYRDKRDEK